jgi:tetratricopeptide (TPR) repeat protein
VAQALDLALNAAERWGLAERPTRSLAAYDAYLKGKAIWSSTNDPVSARRAAGYYEQAVALDSTFAPAWARLSIAHSYLYAAGVASPGEGDAARRAAERAVALAPSRPDGHIALGHYHRLVTGEYAQALEQYRLAEQLAPSAPGALQGLAELELQQGSFEVALQHLQQAQTLDPRSVITAGRLAYTLLSLRRYPGSLAACDRGLVLAPANLDFLETKAMVFLAEGDLAGRAPCCGECRRMWILRRSWPM